MKFKKPKIEDVEPYTKKICIYDQDNEINFIYPPFRFIPYHGIRDIISKKENISIPTSEQLILLLYNTYCNPNTYNRRYF